VRRLRAPRPMLVENVSLSFVLLALFGALFVLHRLRRRLETGEVTEVERRHARTLQRFQVEIDHFKFTRQRFVKVMLNHDHAIWTQIEAESRGNSGVREALRLRVHRYVDEIVPFFKPLTYYGFG